MRKAQHMVVNIFNFLYIIHKIIKQKELPSPLVQHSSFIDEETEIQRWEMIHPRTKEQATLNWVGIQKFSGHFMLSSQCITKVRSKLEHRGMGHLQLRWKHHHFPGYWIWRFFAIWLTPPQAAASQALLSPLLLFLNIWRAHASSCNYHLYTDGFPSQYWLMLTFIAYQSWTSPIT